MFAATGVDRTTQSRHLPYPLPSDTARVYGILSSGASCNEIELCMPFKCLTNTFILFNVYAPLSILYCLPIFKKYSRLLQGNVLPLFCSSLLFVN